MLSNNNSLSENGSVLGSDGSSLFNNDLNAADPSSLLDAAFASIQNLQNEVFIMMSDVRDLDRKILTLQAKMEEEDSILQKHYYKQYKDGKDPIKTHTKETEINERIEQYLAQIKEYSAAKLSITTSLNYMVTVKYEELKNSMTKLSSSGQLTSLEALLKEDRDEILKDFFNKKYKSVLHNRLLGTDGGVSESESPSDSDNTDSDREEETKRKRKPTNKKNISSGSASNKANVNNNRLKNNELDAMQSSVSAANGEDDDDQLYCFCQTVSFGEMVACDNNDCKYQWFHYGCIGLNEPPKGVWYCPECRKK